MIGEATAFGGSTAVNPGAGIVVSSSFALSGTALQTELVVSSTAAIGPRSVSVTTGAQTLLLNNGLVVTPSVSAVVAVGSLSQGGTAFVRAQIAAGRSFEPTIVGSALAVGNAIFLPSAGLSAVSKRWLSDDTAELRIEVSPFASVATAASLAVFYSDGATDTASNFAPIDFTFVTPVTVGGPAEAGALFVPGEAGLFSVAVANAPVSLHFVVTPEPGPLAPRVRLYPSGSATPMADINGTAGTIAIATNGTYTFSVTDLNVAGGFVGYGYTFALIP